MSRIIAIITARGGSKRIPRKNIKEFMGKPMLAYAIEAAKQSKLFDVIMVSTEDSEIADVAKKYGAEVPFMRSAKTSSDFATTYDVLDEVISEYKKQNQEFDIICCIYPCVPFLSGNTIKEAYGKLDDCTNAVMPVCKYSTPIEWALKFDKNFVLPYDSKALKIRSQDLEPKYYDAGMFYFCKTNVLLKEKTLVPAKTAGFIIDETECQDIDNLSDWHMAEIKYTMLKEGK